MKYCTDLEQSKELDEILPVESADMRWVKSYFESKQSDWFINLGKPIKSKNVIPCWSLAALLDYLSANFHVDIKCLGNHWELDCRVAVVYSKNLVDACYDMIIQLKDKRML